MRGDIIVKNHSLKLLGFLLKPKVEKTLENLIVSAEGARRSVESLRQKDRVTFYVICHGDNSELRF